MLPRGSTRASSRQAENLAKSLRYGSRPHGVGEITYSGTAGRHRSTASGPSPVRKNASVSNASAAWRQPPAPRPRSPTPDCQLPPRPAPRSSASATSCFRPFWLFFAAGCPTPHSPGRSAQPESQASDLPRQAGTSTSPSRPGYDPHSGTRDSWKNRVKQRNSRASEDLPGVPHCTGGAVGSRRRSLRSEPAHRPAGSPRCFRHTASPDSDRATIGRGSMSRSGRPFPFSRLRASNARW